jgi:hypothetical protein
LASLVSRCFDICSIYGGRRFRFLTRYNCLNIFNKQIMIIF